MLHGNIGSVGCLYQRKQFDGRKSCLQVSALRRRPRQHELGEREQYAAYCWRLERKDKAQMIALFYDYIQDNHAKGYQTKWGQWKRQFSDK